MTTQTAAASRLAEIERREAEVSAREAANDRAHKEYCALTVQLADLNSEITAKQLLLASMAADIARIQANLVRP